MNGPNRLIHELSPYLLQHSANPVDWWPWCDEAFAEAARRDVPVLVSIGYSACHWCHVMEHESFSNEATAATMNERMVCIKVDREERPDVDALHMEFLQRTGGHGGWPLNVFVTPERIPFHGGTYFPPVRRGQMPSWLDVVDGICAAYHGHKDRISGSRERIKAALEERQEEATDSLPGPEEAREGMEKQILSLDPVRGGFPGAPKFPPHGFLQAALSLPDLSREEDRRLRTTVDRIAQGGIRDHLGGGFARYSTDENWLVPHFEKMLYDNAQLLWVLAESYARWKDPRHARAARETADWMFRELGSPQGGLMSALDADSEGEEGLFYVWAWSELEGILGSDLHDFAKIWQASPRGNFEGRNILWRADPGSEPPDPREAAWFGKLRKVREGRIRPGLDSKVLASWNGLAVSGLARAGVRLGDPSFLRRAENVAGFCLTLFRDEAGLSGVWKDGRTRDGATLEDWAFLGEGFLELWQATGTPRWLGAAERCVRGIMERFRSEGAGVLRFSEAARTDLLADVSPLHDNATPSGNGSAARLLARFRHLTGNDEYRAVAEGICVSAGTALARFPRSYSSLWEAARLLSADVFLAHLAGDSAHPGFARLEESLMGGAAVPDLRVVGAVPDSLRGGFAGAHPSSGRPQVWICRGTECLPPVEDPRSLESILSRTNVRSDDREKPDSGIG